MGRTCVAGVMLLAAILAPGCGGGGGGSGGGGGTPVAAVLQSIVVSPGTVTLDTHGKAALTCLGQYSNGSQQALSATWSISDPAVASLDGAAGTTAMLTGVDEGDAVVTAQAAGMTAQADVSVVDMLPADPGPVYGGSETDIVQYPASGGGPPTVIYTPPSYVGMGFTPNRAATVLYTMGWNDTGDAENIYSYDTRTGASALVVSIPTSPYDRPFGLDYDAQGRLYTTCYGTGALLRITPATGAIEALGTAPAYSNFDLAVGRDDMPYYAPMGGPTWITRHDYAAGPPTAWAEYPPSFVTDYPDFVIPCGLAINRRGEAFTTDVNSSVLYVNRDLNGDGDALDAGEATAFADMGGAYGDYFIYGVSAAKGNSVLLNVTPWGSATSALGVHWLRDLNGDGDALDPGESTLYNATYTPANIDGSCVGARR